MLKSFAFIILIFIICLLILSLWGFYSALHPPKIFTDATPKSYGVQYEAVTFRTKDHLLINAWFVPARHKNASTIILLHGYGGDKGELLATRLFLHKHFNLLFFDFRYFGKSEGKYSTVGVYEVQDLQAAIQFLKTIKNIQEVGIWGLSMGGAVALLTAAQSKEIKALVIESSYARLDMMASNYFQIPILKYPLAMLLRLWGYLFLGEDLKKIAPVDAASKINVPVLLIYSQSDLLISSQQGEMLEKALSNNQHKDVWVFKTAPHAGLEQGYETRVEQFFLKYTAHN